MEANMTDKSLDARHLAKSAPAFGSHGKCIWYATCTLIFVLLSNPARPQNDTATYEYDALGRLTKVEYPNGQTKEFQFDPAGNRTNVLLGGNDGPVNDNIPSLGVGPNLINLTDWPTGNAPIGAGDVTNWPTASTYYNESRWARIIGPGESNSVTAMEVGQTEPDNNGGGTNKTNTFVIDETKAYEYSIYFRKYDLAYQNLYFGATYGGMVKYGNATSVQNNPYFIAWPTGTQAANLSSGKWYKIVGYVFPEGYPIQSNNNWGGVYDVATGVKIANSANYRWNENRLTDNAYARFFTYYSQTTQNKFTNYFYQPEVRVTGISYIPVVPALSISHADGTEGSNVTFHVNLSAATTVETRVDYVVDHQGGTGSASAADYVAVSGTLTIPQGATQASISVSTVQDSFYESNESVRLTLASPIRASISETSEFADIIDDDTPPSFSVNDVSVNEGGVLSFVVTKANATSQSYSVGYATLNGSAAAGSDYSYKSGTLTFAPSQTSGTVTVVTTQDSIVEADEYLYLTLSNASGAATIADGQGIGMIINDDVANAPPNATNDSYFYLETCCSPVPTRYINPVLNDSDPDGDTMTITSISQPQSGVSATITGATTLRLNISVTYYSGSFSYTISDGNGGSDTATIFISIEEDE
jgi:YD repeat-containing protein